jgi:long-chain acyl-CoA synthetase
VLKASHVSALLTSRRHLPSVVRMAASLPTVKLIVLLEDETLECDRTAVAGLAAISDRVRFLSFNDALDAGRRSPVDLSRPSPDDIATICFTSGSGGRPRGAVLTHGNLCSVVASARLSGLEFGPRDVHLSYIPLAHMFERLVVSAIIAGGGSIGFYRGNVAMLLDDAIELRPTVFPSVPRVWNRIHDRITAAMNNAQEMFLSGALFFFFFLIKIFLFKN